MFAQLRTGLKYLISASNIWVSQGAAVLALSLPVKHGKTKSEEWKEEALNNLPWKDEREPESIKLINQ